MSVAFKFDMGSHRAQPCTQYEFKDGIFLKGSNGAAVILVHGLTGIPSELRFPAMYLNRKGYSVLCPRLANHGEPLEVLKYSRWEDFYSTVRNAFFEARKDNRQVFVAGLSMGALLSLALAHEFPGEIAGVCCLSPTLFYDGWNTPRCKFLLPLLYATFLKRYFYFKEDPPYGLKNQKLQERVHKYYQDATLDTQTGASVYGYPFFPVMLLYQLQLLVRYLDPRLPEITVPVQLIQAQDDDMTSMKNSTYIYDRINSVRKNIVVLYNSYHMITADQERAKVAAEMEEFFTALRENGGVLTEEFSHGELRVA